MRFPLKIVTNVSQLILFSAVLFSPTVLATITSPDDIPAKESGDAISAGEFNTVVDALRGLKKDDNGTESLADDRFGLFLPDGVAPTQPLDVNGSVKATYFIGDGSNLTNLPEVFWTASGNDINYGTGRVGIGVATPERSLHVVGTSIAPVTLENAKFYGAKQSTGSIHSMIGMSTGNDTLLRTPDDFIFQKGELGTQNQLMVIKGTGNVGVGTPNPQAEMHIMGDIIADNIYTTGGSGGTGTVLETSLWDDATGGVNYSGGNVGIGTIAPTASLDVQGQIRGGFGARTTGGVKNWNDASNARSGSGYTLLLGSDANGPGGSYYHPFSFEYNSKNGAGNLAQFAIPYASTSQNTGMYMRTRYGGSWQNWSRIISENTSGNVGIVTTSPSEELHLSKSQAAPTTVAAANSSTSTNTNTRAGFAAQSNSAGIDMMVYGGNASGTMGGKPKADAGYLRTLSGSPVSSLNVGNGGNVPLHLFTNDTTQMTITGAGDIGVGNEAPQDKLHITGTVRADDFVDQAGNPIGGGLWTQNGTSAYYSLGNVGVGTTSPATNLHIRGATGLTLDHNFVNATQLKAVDTILEGASSKDDLLVSAAGGILLKLDNNNNGSGSGLGLQVYNRANSALLTVLESNGNTGINNTAPGHKLDVDGNIRSRVGRIYYYGTADQRVYGDNSSALYYNSNHSSVTQKIYRDKESTVYGRVYGAGDGANFGLLDGDGNWFLESIKDIRIGFRVNNLEKMAILTNGNVGIGTATPTSRLEVNGGNGDTVLKIVADVDNVGEEDNPTLWLEQDGGAIDSAVGIVGSAAQIYTGSTANATYINADVGSATDIQLATSGTARVTVKGAGNVGINNTAPGHKLDVDGNIRSRTGRIYYYGTADQRIYGDNSSALYYSSNHSSVTQKIYRDKESTVYGRVYGDGNGANFGLLDGDGHWAIQSQKDNNINFRLNNSEKMRVLMNGRVGIGTSTPTQQLEVVGTVLGGDATATNGSVGFGIRYTANDMPNTFGSHYANAATVVGYGVRPKSAGSGYTSSAGNTSWGRGALNMTHTLTFSNRAASTIPVGTNVTLTERFRIDSAGNVGIGSTAPNKKLHVEGDMRVNSGGNGSISFGAGNQYIYGDGSSALYYRSANSSTTQQIFQDAEGTTYGRVYGSGNGANFGLVDKDGAWAIRHVSDSYTSWSVNSSEKMRVNSSGNLGIGLTSPSSRLEVAGDIEFSGVLKTSSGEVRCPVDRVMVGFNTSGIICEFPPQLYQ